MSGADEFYRGIWWVPDERGLRSANPGECAAEIKRLRLIEEHAGMLRDAVESIGAGHSTLAETIRGQCRLLVRAYDEGAKV